MMHSQKNIKLFYMLSRNVSKKLPLLAA